MSRDVEPIRRSRLLWLFLVPWLASVSAGCPNVPHSTEPKQAENTESRLPSELVEPNEPSPPARPSIVLVVIDTLRADAVSAYGHVEGTTPTIDRMAAEGIRYENAFAPSPWTLPSHATLFTGLNVREHGVGVGTNLVAPDSLTTLAESLHSAGYQTAGFSENILVGPGFGLAQGFDHFEWPRLSEMLENKESGRHRMASFDVVSRVREWFQQIDPKRPYFLFVNLYDTHSPYEVHDHNDFLPDDVDSAQAQETVDHYPVGTSHCARIPNPEALSILKGLYLGGVQRADEKLAQILESVNPGKDERRPITVITSDHGESLGEHRLLGHRFSVRNTTLQIPLIVSGLPGVRPTSVSTAVGLIDVHSSIQCWAGRGECTTGLPEENRPSESDQPGEIFAYYSDETVSELVKRESNDSLPVDQSRSACAASDLVFGEMAAVIRFPMKLLWFESGQTLLYDLSWDRNELSDQKRLAPEVADKMLAQLNPFLEQVARSGDRSSQPHDVDDKSIEALRELGYVE